MNLFQKISAGVAAAGAFLASGVSAFAAAPTVDATVSAATTDVITGLNNAGLTGLTSALTVGGVLLVTAALVFWVIKHFRAIVHI